MAKRSPMNRSNLLPALILLVIQSFMQNTMTDVIATTIVAYKSIIQISRENSLRLTSALLVTSIFRTIESAMKSQKILNKSHRSFKNRWTLRQARFAWNRTVRAPVNICLPTLIFLVRRRLTSGTSMSRSSLVTGCSPSKAWSSCSSGSTFCSSISDYIISYLKL